MCSRRRNPVADKDTLTYFDENYRTILLTDSNKTDLMNKIAYINDQPYEINDGETILSFVRRHINSETIPTLCDAPNLDPFGACRVCSVDVAFEQLDRPRH